MKRWLQDLLEAIFPFSCHVCAKSAPLWHVLCPACERAIRAGLRPPFNVTDLECDTPVFALGFYEGPLAAAIKAIKYRPSRRLFEQIAPLIRVPLQGRVIPEVAAIDVFIPVPLFPEREAKRTFNQAELISRLFAETLGIHHSRAITRTRNTLPQAECTEENRQANLENAFSLAPGLAIEAFRGKTLAVIDDVVTTGNTLDECALPLRALKPKQIIGLSLAHTPRYFARESSTPKPPRPPSLCTR